MALKRGVSEGPGHTIAPCIACQATGLRGTGALKTGGTCWPPHSARPGPSGRVRGLMRHPINHQWFQGADPRPAVWQGASQKQER